MTTLTPEAIRDLRSANSKMRERDFARIHKISEADLVASYVGLGNTRLTVDLSLLLEEMPSCGEVMALTRNESVVHEKIGPFVKGSISGHAGIVLGEQIDLHAVVIDRYLEQLCAVGQRGRAAVGVGRGLDDDQVAGIDEQFAGEVEALHAAGGDHQAVVGRRVGRGGEVVDEQL